MSEDRRRTRRAALTLGVVTLGGLVVGPSCRASATGTLRAEVRAFTGVLSPDMAYRAPSDAEANEAVAALLELVARSEDTGVAPVLARHGFDTTTVTDTAGTGHVLVASDPVDERSWGLVAVPVARRPRVVVEVPHPNSDYETEEVGLELAARVDGAVLVVAGAHRRAAGRDADVAHRTSSLFHRFVTRLAGERDLPQVQLHGFDDDHAPEHDVILSPGAGRADAGIERAADALEDAGFAVCRAWREDCGDLEGRGNVQGVAAARMGTPFVHVEMSSVVREHRRRRIEAAAALAHVTGPTG